MNKELKALLITASILLISYQLLYNRYEIVPIGAGTDAPIIAVKINKITGKMVFITRGGGIFQP